MGTLLIDQWLSAPAEVVLPVVDAASVALVRETTRKIAAERGLPEVAAESLVTAASELAHNLLRHAVRGWVIVTGIEREGTGGVEVTAADQGGGIEDLVGAFSGSGRSASGLGVGLSGVLRLADELDVDDRIGEGLCIRARKFSQPMRRRREVGIVGRPHPEEPASGDGAAFVREDDGALLLIVADGLGHGILAQDSALEVVGAASAAAGGSLQTIYARADERAREGRGAVMALVRIDERLGQLRHLGAGDIMTQIRGPKRSQSISCAAGYLGRAQRPRQGPPLEQAAVAPHELVLMHTDGLSSRVTIEEDDPLLMQRPWFVAQVLLERHRRGTDDALILVTR